MEYLIAEEVGSTADYRGNQTDPEIDNRRDQRERLNLRNRELHQPHMEVYDVYQSHVSEHSGLQLVSALLIGKDFHN